ncbi:hypothetical protein HK100_003375, partial [Physocladia obscura]
MGSLTHLPTLTIRGSLVAFGDVNSDKKADLFVAPTGQEGVGFWLWDETLHSFDSFSLVTAQSTSQSQQSLPQQLLVPWPAANAANAIPADFDRDGILDLLLMATDAQGKLLMEVHWGSNQNSINITSSILPSATTAQPFLVDIDGSLSPALLGYTYADPSNLSVWSFTTNRTVSVSPAPAYFLNQSKSVCSYSSPHSNAFIDLNGDCLADLFLTCFDKSTSRSYFQIWTNSRDNGFALVIEQNFPTAYTGPVTFADMDADGTMDMVFNSCDDLAGKSCHINILYNSQIPLCSTSILKGSSCRPVNDLCSADESFDFRSVYSKIPLQDVLPSAEEKIDLFAMPLRLGDFDKDGFPDILILTHTRYTKLLQSIPCTKFICSNIEFSGNKRFFKTKTVGTETLNALEGEKTGAAFFDLYEDGTLDILVFSKDNAKIEKIDFFRNDFYSDGFFLKSLVLNGVCPGWCDEGEKFPDPKPYGVNFAGATLKYTVIDTNGQKHATQLAQLPQSSYFALNTPYTLAGLGRTNNYIETLSVGTSKQKRDNVATYYGMIPNSQLVIIPYEADADEGPSSWKLEMFINPSKFVPWVFVSILSTIVAFSGVVMFLHYFEM